MRGSIDSKSDEEPIASMKPERKKKTKTETKSVTLNNFPPNEAIAGTSTALTNNQSASKTSTAATANATVPGDVANVNFQKKRKAKKKATKIALPTCRNQKRKKDLDEGIVDTNFPNPPEVEDHVPSHVCNWTQAIVCNYHELAPQKCKHPDCDFLVHRLFQAAWEQREGHPDTVTGYCCLHHPQYKYQNIIDRSGVSKKSLSSNSGCKMSDDTNATIAEKDNNVIQSVQDGKNELLRHVLSSATNNMKETTVSHLNESRQNIVVDGKVYRCNKVRVVGEKNNVVYVKYLQCEMALDKADGLKWKPYNKVKATSSSKKIGCYVTLCAEFSKVCWKVISHYYPANKSHI